jgi:hypothetical protein
MSDPKADMAPAKKKLFEIGIAKALPATREFFLDFMAKLGAEMLKPVSSLRQLHVQVVQETPDGVGGEHCLRLLQQFFGRMRLSSWCRGSRILRDWVTDFSGDLGLGFCVILRGKGAAGQLSGFVRVSRILLGEQTVQVVG